MFWLFILACLMLLFSVWQKSAQRPNAPDAPIADQTSIAETPNSTPTARAVLENVGPFLLLIGIWILTLVWFIPMRLRRIYRRDPFMQGEFTVDITPVSISIRNTAGTTSQTGWNVYERWREGKGLIVLTLHSGGCFAMNIASLSDVQRDELRGILSVALPKRPRSV